MFRLQVTFILCLSLISAVSGQDIDKQNSNTGRPLLMQNIKQKKVKSITETVFSVGPHASETGEVINEYHFDKNGNLTQRKWFVTTGREGRHYWQSDFKYAPNQQLTQATRFSSTDPKSVHVEDYGYDKEKGLTTISVHSADDPAIVRKYVQMQNQKGQLLKSICYEPVDTIDYIQTHYYNDLGQRVKTVITSEFRPITIKTSNKKGNQSKLALIPHDSSFLLLQYDKSGNVTEEKSFYHNDPDGETTYKIKQTYNSENQLVVFRQMSLQERVYVRFTFHYDTKGLLTEAIEYYPEDYPVRRYQFTYSFY